MYNIETSTGRVLQRVYCEMDLNGGGYTFLNPSHLSDLTDDELQAMYTDRTSVLLRVRDRTGSQPYAVLEQLPRYSSHALKLGLNNHVGFQRPVNVNSIGPNYLYVGFLPTSVAQSRTTQGLQVNGVDVAFVNCDSNPNSYIALFPNFADATPTDYVYSARFPLFSRFTSAFRPVLSGSVISEDFFMFFETHMGGCGWYTQTDGRPSINGIYSASIGFR